MKLSYCCFIAFIFIIVAGSGFESKNSSRVSQFHSFPFSDVSTGVIKKVFITNAIVKKVIDSESPEGNHENQKKRNKKGVKPVLFCITNECNYKINILLNEVLVFVHPFYNSCTFPGNEKRGPPQFASS